MVELLAPVRDMISLTAAIEAGADAVYFGVGHLNMRINSKGIDPKELRQAVKKAHDNGCKVYVTVNAIIYDEEIEEMHHLLDCIKEADADAIICWDPSVIRAAKQRRIPFHISTQASISNKEALHFYEELGAERAVLARELSLKQIESIKAATQIEIEVFAHGAMCVSVSGRCFMSQFLHCRSANRGDCLQPCRREYQVIDKETGDALDLANGFIMSPKDLCTLPLLPEIISAGVDVLKIEGRSRSPEYIKTVVSAYRRALDAIASGSYDRHMADKLTAEVAKVYNRGFSTGFLMGRPGPESWTDAYGSKATQRKEYVGKVLNYYKKAQAAYIEVLSNPISVGDTIQIHGPTTGVVEMPIEELRNEEGQKIRTADRTTATLPCASHVRPNDAIFIIKDTNPHT
ncbi:MAG: peptidase U32 family protein [Nanoarchaeota archaeon]